MSYFIKHASLFCRRAIPIQDKLFWLFSTKRIAIAHLTVLLSYHFLLTGDFEQYAYVPGNSVAMAKPPRVPRMAPTPLVTSMSGEAMNMATKMRLEPARSALITQI